MRESLCTHTITLFPQPSRYSDNTDRVERNNGGFKNALDRIQKSDVHARPEELKTLELFITNIIMG